ECKLAGTTGSRITAPLRPGQWSADEPASRPFRLRSSVAQMGGVVEGAEDGGAVGVPVDLAEGRDVEVHPVERGGRGEQGGGDQRLDRGHVADDEDRLVGPFGQYSMQGGEDPLADLGEALPA